MNMTATDFLNQLSIEYGEDEDDVIEREDNESFAEYWQNHDVD